MRARPKLAVPVLLSLSLSLPLPGFASIPLPSSPSWTSVDDDYSTGGAFADINGDGWIDFLTSNGNDMAMDHNGIYMNNGGTLDTVASWRSADSGYFGHCYVGDVNNDGLPDLAVAYLGSSSNGDRHARLYLNNGGTLGTAPAWIASDRHSSFDCCLGDFDLDGRLDLAVVAGDAYEPEYDRARIYHNNGTTFDTLPCWSASDTNPGDAIRFCDIDNDGDLDLFVGQVVPNSGHGKVTMYRNNGGVLDTVPSWTAQTGVGWVLGLAFGDYDGDGYLDLAVASNDQMGEPNSIKVFHNNHGALDTVAAFTMLRTNTYSSCVAWADVNGDGYPDLAAGGWWEPVVVFENHAGVLDTTPTWSWNPTPPDSLICETVAWGDVANRHLAEVTEAYDGDGQRKLFNLHRRPLQTLDSVYVAGVRVPVAGFCFDLLGGWVSFASAPPAGSANVIFFYSYSPYPDLAVTNWGERQGNHVFMNTTPAGISGTPGQLVCSRLRAWPNPSVGPMMITVSGSARGLNRTVTVYDRAGRLRRTLSSSGGTWVWDGRDQAGQPIEPGVYFAKLGPAGPALKLIRISGR